MDFELRTILLVAGVVVIAAILIHGLIGIRKANKPIDISHLNLNETDDDGNAIRDGGGFDRHGVGVVRKKEPTNTEAASVEEVKPTDKISSEEADNAPVELVVDETVDDTKQQESINFSVALEPQSDASVLGEIESSTTMDEEVDSAPAPVFDSPIMQEKEDYLEPRVGATKEHSEPKEQVKEPAKEQAVQKTLPSEPMDVLVLNVVASDNQEIGGAVLLPTLLTLGLKFGEMNIFHRHQQATGKGDVLFSLVNMVNPGTFDIDNMEQFSTSGVSLFMTIPHQHGNMETFNMMLNAAAKIAEAFNGQVLDGDRSTLTKQSTQHYVQRIREVERKLLLIK